MNICAPFIQRPIMTTLVMAALLIFGILGYQALPISDLPNVDFPTITVNASLPGATPETMATSVATPLERQFATIAGIDSMTSANTQGQTTITLQFDLDRNIDAAAQDVQAAIATTIKRLPSQMTTPPSYRKVNPAAAPILFFALSSDDRPMVMVDEYAETFLAQRISMVNGVAQVNVYGPQKYAVRIDVDPNKLANRQLTMTDIANSVTQHNVNQPTGILFGPRQTYYIQADGQLKNAAAYRDLIVRYQNGAPIKLNDVADINNSVENNKTASWFNQKRAIVLAVQRQPGTNTIEIVNDIKKLLPSFQAQLPAGITLNTLYDRSQMIRHSVDDVQFTLILAAILVVGVIYLFLRNLSAIIIPTLAMPFSLIGTFAVMYLLNYSLDNLSLLALTLAVGFVVDDAIVMLENIMRHIEHGQAPMAAALAGAKEIAFTIFSMTISLTVVFIPVLFMPGVMGRVMHEFAVTICLAILFSGIISLTLTPMLASRMIKSKMVVTEDNNDFFSRLKERYDNTLQMTLRHPRMMLMAFLMSVTVVVILFNIIPKTFLPNEDSGQVFASTEYDPSLSFDKVMKLQQQVANTILQNPGVLNVMSSVGNGGGGDSNNSGRVFINLKPLNERTNADKIIEQLRPKLNRIPGASVYLQNMPSIRIGGRASKSSYQYTLQSTDLNELSLWEKEFLKGMQALPALQDVTSDATETGPQIFIKIKRDRAAVLGVTPLDIENTLADAYGTQQISTIYTSTDNYAVILEVNTDNQTDPSDLAKLYVRNNSGNLVPLTAVIDIRSSNGPIAINHQGQLPATTISFNLKPNYSLSQAMTEILDLKDKLNPPATLIADFAGNAKTFSGSQSGQTILILLAIVVIYIVLGILYESFIHPLTILSGLPAAGIGGLLTLAIFGIPLDIYGIIGIVMLLGIVKKNAIMMVDFAIVAERQQHLSARDAIYQACLTRFRPIMMTTMAALLGTLPIAIGFGAGADTRRGMGLVVVGGLLLSQFVTLFLTPTIYIYLDGLKKRRAN